MVRFVSPGAKNMYADLRKKILLAYHESINKRKIAAEEVAAEKLAAKPVRTRKTATKKV